MRLKRFGGRAVALMAGAALVLPLVPPALAENGAGMADQVAQADEQHIRFDIPAQPLPQALNAFGRQAGLQITGLASVTSALQSRAVSGTLTAAQALTSLLAGTGLTFSFSDPRTVVLEKLAAANGAVTLDPVTVEGAGRGQSPEAADRTVTGYVAKRSGSATKSDTSLLEIPQSVSVITRDQMEAQDVQRLNEALRYTAGVVPETRGSIASRYDMFTVRGFDSDSYWNGLKLNGNGWYILPQLDTYFFERVEVMKGTSSALYGQAKAGGVVQQVGKQPTEIPQNEVGVEFGTDSHMRATFDFSGPVPGNDRILYRVIGAGLSEDTQQKSVESQRVAFMPSVTLKPGDDTSINLYALYQHDPKAGSYGTVPAAGTVFPGPKGYIATDFYDGDLGYERFDRTQAAFGYMADSALAQGLRFRANGRWFGTKQDYASVYGDGAALDSDGNMGRGAIRSKDRADSYAFDNQLEGKFTTGPVRHTLLGGLDYQYLKGSYSAVYGTASAINAYNPVYGSPNVSEYYATGKTSVEGAQTGLYMQDQIGFNRFLLTLSGRKDWARSEILTGDTRQFDQAFTGRAGLTYTFDNGIAPYVSYSQSFTPQTGVDALTGVALKPEEGEQYEVGVKYQPTGTNALFTAALYELTRSNLMTYVSTLGGYVQSGEARSRGFELEAKGDVTADLSMTASYTYLDTKYVKDDSGLTGKRLGGLPRNIASVWADYKIPSGTLQGLGLGAGVRYFDDTTNSANSLDIGGATLVDAAIRYDLGKADSRLAGGDIYLNAKNLFDQKYVTCFYGDVSGSTNWCSYGYQRTVIGGLRYRW